MAAVTVPLGRAYSLAKGTIRIDSFDPGLTPSLIGGYHQTRDLSTNASRRK
ncbi:hypothetical protein OHJ21_03950 [Virgibacillus sp. LDC1]|uniref:hypothetical protein n=1 Tax=Paenibacillus sp. GM2FR TaxID=2059268 RepID=UPI0013FDE6B1|nr:hypothetical protein [Paenibacillus sp. GM2FR]MCV4230312.1 hypothetical protein [Virgibacillus sp. LDC1]